MDVTVVTLQKQKKVIFTYPAFLYRRRPGIVRRSSGGEPDLRYLFITSHSSLEAYDQED